MTNNMNRDDKASQGQNPQRPDQSQKTPRDNNQAGNEDSKRGARE